MPLFQITQRFQESFHPTHCFFEPHVQFLGFQDLRRSHKFQISARIAKFQVAIRPLHRMIHPLSTRADLRSSSTLHTTFFESSHQMFGAPEAKRRRARRMEEWQISALIPKIQVDTGRCPHRREIYPPPRSHRASLRTFSCLFHPTNCIFELPH